MSRLFLLWLACALLVKAQSSSPAVLAIQDSLQSDDLEKASQLIHQALAAHPNDAGVLNLRGVVHARRNEIAAARQDFASATRLAPSLTPAWQNLARACQQIPDSACAVEAWQHVLRSKPTDPEAASSLLDLYSNGVSAPPTAIAKLAEILDAQKAATLPTLQRLAIAYEQLHRSADARKTLERVALLDPTNTAHLLELARLADSTKDYEAALGYLAHARDLAPDNARIHFLYGVVSSELNLPIEAKQSLEKALTLDPSNPSYNYAMGSVILMTRDASTAASYLQKYVMARPSDPSGHYALGLAYFASGDYTNSKLEMRLAAASPSNAAAANYYLGRIARLEGDLDEAIKCLRLSLSLAPKFSEPHTELARIALLNNDTTESLTQLNVALKLSPDNFQANEQLLVVYKRTNDPRATAQAARLKQLDEARSKRADLMLRTVGFQP